MIKVLKHGSVYKKLKKKCSACGCVFIFDRDDVDDSNDLDKKHITCPECNNIMNVTL